jgi:hypothetical protein
MSRHLKLADGSDAASDGVKDGFGSAVDVKLVVISWPGGFPQ